jgi:hypothetical protein
MKFINVIAKFQGNIAIVLKIFSGADNEALFGSADRRMPGSRCSRQLKQLERLERLELP